MSADELREMGYLWPRQLADGRWIALLPMLYTTGLFVDLDEVGYAYRYCYEHSHHAVADLQMWDGVGEPPGPWIKRKGRGGDHLNPRWLEEVRREMSTQTG